MAERAETTDGRMGLVLDERDISELRWIVGYIQGLRSAAAWPGAKVGSEEVEGVIDPIDRRVRDILGMEASQ